MIANGYGAYLRSHENVLNLGCDDCTTLDSLKLLNCVHFEWVDFMVCESCLNEDVFKKKLSKQPMSLLLSQ